MLNNLSRRTRRNFEDMSQLFRLEGKHTTQNAHCALWKNCFLLTSMETFVGCKQETRAHRIQRQLPLMGTRFFIQINPKYSARNITETKHSNV